MSLVLDQVSKRVGPSDHIVDVSLRLEKGSLNVLLGPTLSGKTSLMRLMAGLDRPTSGSIAFNGVDVTSAPVRGRSVAMVYQQFINYPTMSVFENIASPLRVMGLPASEIRERVGVAARLLKLEPMLTRTPLQLSGGQQQRTAIARALVKRAELVLMDEPLANLDYKLREELREELPRIFASTGAIFVYATTEPSEALLLGGNTAVLHQGRVAQFGPTSEVYRNPADLNSAAVFSDPPLNRIAAEKSGGMLRFSGGHIPARGKLASLEDGPCTLGFRAHHLQLADSDADAIKLSGRVTVSEITGSESFIHIDAAPHHFVALAHGVRLYEPGATIETFVDTRRLFVFDRAGRLAASPDDMAGA
ncbi:MAG: ABC transporter ATP-binding protein [Bosea sp.]|jgi:glycerol transport system ATP-binding protein|nr:ABC transporter ATP-binding protein [Bosea sp. (in: a-proteobacteria)]